jgi:hypothetical protein
MAESIKLFSPKLFGLQLLIAGLVKPGETIVDVGARPGKFPLAACRVFGSGKVNLAGLIN